MNWIVSVDGRIAKIVVDDGGPMFPYKVQYKDTREISPRWMSADDFEVVEKASKKQKAETPAEKPATTTNEPTGPKAKGSALSRAKGGKKAVEESQGSTLTDMKTNMKKSMLNMAGVGKGIVKGARIRLKNPIASQQAKEKLLWEEGMRGTVLRIDGDGDASVLFDGAHHMKNQWINMANFGDLEVLEPEAGCEEAGDMYLAGK